MEKILVKAVTIVLVVFLYVKRRSVYYWNYLSNGHFIHDLKPVLRITKAMRSDFDSVPIPITMPPLKRPNHFYGLVDDSFTARSLEEIDGIAQESQPNKRIKQSKDPIETRMSQSGTIEYHCKECDTWSANYNWTQKENKRTTSYKCSCGKAYYVKHV